MYVKSCLAIFFLCALTSQAAVVQRSESTVNTYEKHPGSGVDYGNLEENEIADEYDSVHGLYPPKVNAEDYYDSKTSYPKKGVLPNGGYVIDTVNKVLKLSTEEGSQEMRLKPVEEMEIKKLSAAFAKLFENSKFENYDWGSQAQTEPPITETPSEVSTQDWKKLNPIITVSKSGVSIAFGNESSTEQEGNTESVEVEDRSRDSLWDGISRSVDKILFGELDRRLNATERNHEEDVSTEEAPGKEKPFFLVKFVSSVWNLLSTSIDYVGTLFSNLMLGKRETYRTEVRNEKDNDSTTEADEEEENMTVSPTTTAAMFAYEEPIRYKKLPAEEFETRRRDIDSLFYGYGIV